MASSRHDGYKAAMIARRGVNTLVLVYRRKLLGQGRERLQTFLALDTPFIGTIGGGKLRATGRIDIAMRQSVAPAVHPARRFDGTAAS